MSCTTIFQCHSVPTCNLTSFPTITKRKKLVRSVYHHLPGRISAMGQPLMYLSFSFTLIMLVHGHSGHTYLTNPPLFNERIIYNLSKYSLFYHQIFPSNPSTSLTHTAHVPSTSRISHSCCLPVPLAPTPSSDHTATVLNNSAQNCEHQCFPCLHLLASFSVTDDYAITLQ